MTKKNDIPKELQVVLKDGEKKSVFMDNWHEHVMARHEVESFTTIVNDRLFHIKPKEDEILMPYMEINGDHNMCWILSLSKATNEEMFRKNIRTVDMVHWKLSSSLTKLKQNEE